MQYQAPLFVAGNIVYLRSSAANGFIESHVISGLKRDGDHWVYTVSKKTPSAIPHTHFGERRSIVTSAVLEFRECEFVSYEEALELAENYLQNQIDIIRAKRAAIGS